MRARDIVLRVIDDVARTHGRHLPPLTDDLSLLDSGLDSLCLAVIVANLEDELGIDPFSTAEDGALPETIGALVSLYEEALV